VFFRQVLYRDLGCASYVLGDGGEAAVVDPRWDIDVYLDIAAAERLRITHVLDTHDHADHLSGRLRLVAATGACSHRPDPAREFGDGIFPGEEIAVGGLRMRAVATPGHRPEHLTLVVCDLSRGDDPWLVLTGDSLLVGDIARPDLAVEASEGARALHGSLQQLLGLGDHVEVWPAHVGGSLCGGAGLSGKTNSTIGFERMNDPLLMMDQRQFVHSLTSSLPSRPPNVDRIVALNRRHDTSGDPADPPELELGALRTLLRAGATVLDSRLPEQFDAGHLAGAINLPVSSAGVGTRAGWALDPEDPVVIVASDAGAAGRMVSALQAVGFWSLAGYVEATPEHWERAGLPVAQASSWDLDQLVAGLRGHAVELVDVRELNEWTTGHVPGSHHVPLKRLRDVRGLPLPDDGRTTAVACAAGIRAAFAASLFRRAGRRDVVRIAGGGVPDLRARGLELQLGID
jgi:glyoxylase-like metal-dependent hydrolase (beta-lactamase superfamily II)/rhodanese-related sulfurtransferase